MNDDNGTPIQPFSIESAPKDSDLMEKVTDITAKLPPITQEERMGQWFMDATLILAVKVSPTVDEETMIQYEHACERMKFKAGLPYREDMVTTDDDMNEGGNDGA